MEKPLYNNNNKKLSSAVLLEYAISSPSLASHIMCQIIVPFFKYTGKKERKKEGGKLTVIKVGNNQGMVCALPFRIEFSSLVRLKYMPDTSICI